VADISASVGLMATAGPPAMGHVRVFGYEIADTLLAAAADDILRRAEQSIPTSIAFLNAHCINVSARDAVYRDALSSMDRLYGDGIGIHLAARAAGVTLKDNVNGTDLFPEICARAARSNVPLFLFGAADGVAAEAGRRMRDAHAGLVVAGAAHGYIKTRADEDALINMINASGAKILFVALGVPLQERWILQNRHRLNVPVILAVGGLFDYFAGRIPRAPLIIRRLRSEWVWRLAMEPRRLWKRYLGGNIAFLARLAWHRVVRPSSFARRPSLETGVQP
jgi:exopolysaccharide biosynthesis WecB/TagA/CpsF family protein